MADSSSQGRLLLSYTAVGKVSAVDLRYNSQESYS